MGRKINRKRDEIISKKLVYSEKSYESLSDLADTRDNQNFSFNLSHILKKKWKIFRVSPLFNFNNDKLEFYEKKLCEELDSKKKPYSNLAYDSSFSLHKKLKLNDQVVNVLQVEVIVNQTKKVYIGFFISSIPAKKETEEYLSLPILLLDARGHEYKVNSSLSKMFDCDIQPVMFSSCALVTFLVKNLENPDKSLDFSQELFYLEYKIPGCKVQDNLIVTLMLEDTIVVLAMVIDNLRQNINGINDMEIIVEFYNRILNHIYKVYNMNLMLAELNKIVLPNASLTADGQFKVSSEYAAAISLTTLQCFIPFNGIISM